MGVYSSRSVCIGLVEKSFVSGMSTSFSGNLGYPLPRNWVYDQIRDAGTGEDGLNFGLDHVIKRYEMIKFDLWSN
ncbi:glycoside hydrolase domain-containing protein [Polycladospora coralii]|uniref:glycoside hydrolase domain-containing protein n=1 Tax=Polycladospora coralii TaxID=2771432 RepID=UPI003F725E3B